jgi:ankyrin repeat protein
LLVEADADLAMTDARGRSVLHWAVVEGDHDEIVQYLLAKGVSKQSATADGLSARDYAIQLDRRKSIALL